MFRRSREFADIAYRGITANTAAAAALVTTSRIKKMTAYESISVICVTIVGFQLTRLLFRILYNNVLAPTLGINAVDIKEMGKWAVVTGATDGLGKAYAEALAKKGLSIVLISRTQSKLDQVAQEISTKYNVETRTVAVDFTSDNSIYHIIEKQLQGLEIGVLINNVGLSYPYPEFFLSQPDKDKLYPNIIKCNVESVTYMCKIVMPGMVERKRGIVVNVSSTAAQIPSPLLTIYAASKAYVDKFSQDLGREYARHGIIVQSLLPGYVATKMSKIRNSTWMAPSPAKYVNTAMATIGVQDRTTGYFAHTLLVKTLHTLEYLSPSLTTWFVMRTMENIKKRAVKRQGI